MRFQLILVPLVFMMSIHNLQKSRCMVAIMITPPFYSLLANSKPVCFKVFFGISNFRIQRNFKLAHCNPAYYNIFINVIIVISYNKISCYSPASRKCSREFYRSQQSARAVTSNVFRTPLLFAANKIPAIQG